MITVKLTSGEEVNVYSVPPSIHDIVSKRYPLPEVPIAEAETVTGEVQRMAMNEDPDYLAELERVQAARSEAIQEAYTLFSLKDVKVDNGFSLDEMMGEQLRYFNPDWKPREGPVGQKLDYIEFILLANPNDAVIVGNAITEMAGIDEEVIAQIEASFRDRMGGEAD